MNGGEREHPEAASATLDAYVDGQLAGPELSAFEARLSREPELIEQMNAQRQLDRSLRGLFVIPPMAPLPINGHPSPSAPDATAPASGGGARWLSARPRGAVLGGIIALAIAAGSWITYTAFAERRLSFGDIYHQRVQAAAAGVTSGCAAGESGCDLSPHFALVMKEVPAGVQALSTTRAPVLSPHTLVTSVRVDGRDVVILADLADRDRPDASKSLGDANDLHVFRRQVMGIVLYEISPFDTPRLLDHYEWAGSSGCSLIEEE